MNLFGSSNFFQLKILLTDNVVNIYKAQLTKYFLIRSVTPSRMQMLPEPAAHQTQVVSLVIDSLVILIIYYSVYCACASYVNNKLCRLGQDWPLATNTSSLYIS